MSELELELVEARKIYIEAIDSGDEKTENEYSDIIDAIAKILNEKGNISHYKQWYAENSHPREGLECPKEILEEVKDFANGAPRGFNKSVVDRWNEHLDFNLHDKLKTYGMVGAARLNKIFKL
jgi:hypothetical protein